MDGEVVEDLEILDLEQKKGPLEGEGTGQDVACTC